MPALLILLALLTADPAEQATPSRAVIEATIRGTKQPLVVQLLLRDDEGNDWHQVEQKPLPAAARRVRFENLPSGIYQILVKGEQESEQHGTKIAVGSADERAVTIDIEPFELSGRVTLGGVDLGEGLLVLRQKEFHWRAPVSTAADGTFRARLWQQGEYTYTIRGAALSTSSYTNTMKIDRRTAAKLAIDIPDGRITGIVRDAKNGKPLGGVTVALRTTVEQAESNVHFTTDPTGRFEFSGVKYGKQTVRLTTPLHLEPEPIVFELDASARLRELDVQLDAGRTVPLVVIDADSDPVDKAAVFAVTSARLRSRATTDEDGRTSIAVPAGEAATLFIIAPEGGFGIVRLAHEQEQGRLRVHLPRASSSLLIRALKTDGSTMPPISLLMRYNGELVPLEIIEELATEHGLQLATGPASEALLERIPTGSYEFWPYRTREEAEAIVATAAFAAPIQVNVRTGENRIAVKFAAR